MIPKKEQVWKEHSVKTLVKDRWIHLKEKVVELPNGILLDNWYCVELDDWGSVFGITPENMVVLVKQYRHGLGEVFYELPCGIIESDEESAKGCKRELEEETGYTTNENLEFLARVNPSPSKIENWNYCYLARNVFKAGEQQLDDTEEIEVELVHVSKLREMIYDGRIVDSFMTANILMALDKLGL